MPLSSLSASGSLAVAPKPKTKPAVPARVSLPESPESPTPRSLGDIAASEDEDDEDSDGWDADNEREERGPLLNPTGHPDYVPQPGQQPYMRDGH
jgi:hypothetical protein